MFTHADVKPGMIVKAKVVAVEGPGAFVQFPSGVKALCPLRHMSEFDIEKPRKKFKVFFEFFISILHSYLNYNVGDCFYYLGMWCILLTCISVWFIVLDYPFYCAIIKCKVIMWNSCFPL